MEALRDFAEKDMIEQIVVLEEIRERKLVEAVPALMDLYATPLKDQAVDEMVYHALYEILAGQNEAVAQGLRHSSKRVQKLCIRRAGEGCGETLKDALRSCLRSASESSIIAEIIRSLCPFRDPNLIDTLLPFAEDEDVNVFAWTLKALAGIADERVVSYLTVQVKKGAEILRADEECGLRLGLMVENLAVIKAEDALNFFISQIHHPNPVFRRLILTAIQGFGSAALPSLKQCLEHGDKDEKIMAANIVGLIGDKKGADILVSQLGNPGGLEPNYRFALYEALARIPSLKSIVGLFDGLADKDELVLIAVATGLNDLCNPGVVKVILVTVKRQDEQAQRVLNAIIGARAVHLFKALYESDEHRPIVMEALARSKNKKVIAFFRVELSRMDMPQAVDDLTQLGNSREKVAAKKVVAADDSKAMLFFYTSVAAELGLELFTAMDGQEALNYLQSADNVDLLITDLNMPNMTGIELTRELRKMEKWARLPILMATTESEKSQNDAAREAGVTGFISKPFTKEQFKKKLEEIFS